MTVLYPFLAYIFVTTFTPGPNNILAMSYAMRYGYRKILGFLLGIFCGFFVIMLGSGLLNYILAKALPQVEIWLKISGAAYMVYLAARIVFSKSIHEEDGKNGENSFLAGFTLQFLNVKVILYGVTVYSVFIVPFYRDPVRVSAFAPLLAGVGFIATSCWAVGGDLFRQPLQKYYRWFNLAMGALLVSIAITSLL